MCTACHRRFPLSGFSLVEVVLALGVIAFAIVGIMGLLPVAMRAGQESQRETRAALIARSIYADLQTSDPTNLLIATGTSLTDSAGFISPRPSLSNSWTKLVSYDNSGVPISEDLNSAAVFLAEIQCSNNVPLNGLSRVQVNIMTPATAPPSARTTNTFVTLLRQ